MYTSAAFEARIAPLARLLRQLRAGTGESDVTLSERSAAVGIINDDADWNRGVAAALEGLFWGTSPRIPMAITCADGRTVEAEVRDPSYRDMHLPSGLKMHMWCCPLCACRTLF